MSKLSKPSSLRRVICLLTLCLSHCLLEGVRERCDLNSNLSPVDEMAYMFTLDITSV